MYWKVQLKFKDASFSEPWTVMIYHDADYPKNIAWGKGLPVVIPMTPDYDRIKKMTEVAGRPFVPRIETSKGIKFLYFDRHIIGDNINTRLSAYGAALQAAYWIVHFMLSLKDDFVWNIFIEEDTRSPRRGFKTFLIKEPQKRVAESTDIKVFVDRDGIIDFRFEPESEESEEEDINNSFAF